MRALGSRYVLWVNASWPNRMIKRISEERARIDGYKLGVGGAEFFNNREYDEDLEWLILSYLAEILSSVGWPAPEYAQKLNPPEPDFQTYLAPGIAFQRIEVTEVLRPDYRRGKFHRDLAKSGRRVYHIPNPHPEPWSSFLRVLCSKLVKPYSPNASLLIYHDMADSEFSDYIPWHNRILAELRSWNHESETTCDITQSRYDNIYVVDASGVGAVRLYPHWDVVKESASLL